MNTRTFRLLIALFIVLMAIIAVLQLVRRNAIQQQVLSITPTAVSPYVFPAVETTTITRIELENKRTGRKLVFTKIPGDWTAVDQTGGKIDVNLTYMPTLLQILATLRYNRSMNGTETLESFGLADGGWFIVKFTSGAEHMLRIGDNNPDRSQTYVRASIGSTDSPVLQVSAEAISTLARIVELYNLGNASPKASATP